MALNHAQSFVEKFFEDDEFVKEVIIKRGFTKHELEDEENEKMVKVANSMGFNFNIEEYKKANKEYLNNLTGWEAMKKVFHIIKIATYMNNQNND